MADAIHYFSEKEAASESVDLSLLGICGRQANELARLRLPILPCFVIDSSLASNLENADIMKKIAPCLEKCGKDFGKSFAGKENPMLVKLELSSSLATADYPELHNLGLAKDTFGGFAKETGENGASREICLMLKDVFSIERRLAELEARAVEAEAFGAAIKEVSALLESDAIPSGLAVMERFAPRLPAGFFDSASQQLEIMLVDVAQMLKLDEQNDNDTAILIQPMVCGNGGKDSCFGEFFTRNAVTGEKKLQGMFFGQEADGGGKDINGIEGAVLKRLQQIAWAIEDETRDIRQVLFAIENGRLWLIGQREVQAKSAISRAKLLLDLNERKIVDDAYVVSTINPEQLSEVLRPAIDISSVKDIKSFAGGIAGAPGAAAGRVYFSADALLEARRAAQKKGEDARCILLVPAAYAGDVKAIEASCGVLSSEGGYAAHASVVARQYGKVSLVLPNMLIKEKKAVIEGETISEGDYVSLNVPYYGDSAVFFGKAELIEPDMETSGLLDIISLASSFVRDFHVRANADSPKEAELACKFGAEGIGLCRTEHMFFDSERINVFREMLLASDREERAAALKELQKMQAEDFYGIFKAMPGQEVAIRLLDSPLHEFMPRGPQELAEFMDYLAKKGGAKIAEAEVQAKIDAMTETNPMLGRRGCRIAISYPEIYEMQARAIFEAAYRLKKEGGEARPEIMAPLVMSFRELKQIAYGKKIEGASRQGIADIEKSARASFKTEPVDYRIGAMIELPAAALGAGEIARYAQFFSFGTNDLTQATLGLSRDDFSAFMPDYTMYGIFDGNPFAVLDPNVKELIDVAVRRGRETRPNLMAGLCGEHGARPENIKFCMESGLNYVSCSLYSVPMAILAIAQAEIASAKAEGRKPSRRAVRAQAAPSKPKGRGRAASVAEGKPAVAKKAAQARQDAAEKPRGRAAGGKPAPAKPASRPKAASAAKAKAPAKKQDS